MLRLFSLVCLSARAMPMACKTARYLSCLVLPVSSTGHHLDFFPAEHSKELIQALLPIQLVLIPRHLQVDVLEQGPQVCRALHGN